MEIGKNKTSSCAFLRLRKIYLFHVLILQKTAKIIALVHIVLGAFAVLVSAEGGVHLQAAYFGWVLWF